MYDFNVNEDYDVTDDDNTNVISAMAFNDYDNVSDDVKIT